VLLEPAYVLLTSLQLHRALSGNELSWADVFEWPFFGVYSVITWWRIVRGQDLGGPAVHGGTAGQPDGEGVDAGAAAPADRATETTRRRKTSSPPTTATWRRCATPIGRVARNAAETLTR
jgi:hypothetical protein